jgi:hypothetical protein
MLKSVFVDPKVLIPIIPLKAHRLLEDFIARTDKQEENYKSTKEPATTKKFVHISSRTFTSTYEKLMLRPDVIKAHNLVIAHRDTSLHNARERDISFILPIAPVVEEEDEEEDEEEEEEKEGNSEDQSQDSTFAATQDN